MKMFFGKITLGFIPLCLLTEIFCRIVIDPLYFRSIDIYEIKPASYHLGNLYSRNKPTHVDYLFIGSSRVNATINADLLTTKGKVAINAGRGYITGGIHYWALHNWLSQHPDFIKNANIVVELPGGVIFPEDFKSFGYAVYESNVLPNDKAMPHFLLPHIHTAELKDFLTYSNNSMPVKLDMVLLYSSSLYRVVPFIKANINQGLDAMFATNTDKANLLAEGGIKTDVRSIELAKQKAQLFTDADLEKQKHEKPFTVDELNNSVIGAIYNLVKQHGGKLFFYDMPLHSIQKKVTETDLSKTNRQTFKRWTEQHGIPIIDTDEFHYSDADFPDYWHLSASRRDEFTLLLYKMIEESSR